MLLLVFYLQFLSLFLLALWLLSLLQFFLELQLNGSVLLALRLRRIKL